MKEVERNIRAEYLIETAFDPAYAAEVMAGEQSSGTFVRTPGETDELRRNHAAFIESVEVVGEVSQPSLPGARVPKTGSPRYQRAKVTLSWPFENVGANLSNLMATLAGNLFELGPFSGLKLLDFEIPETFAQTYPGPAFGIKGTQRLTSVYQRPVIGTIIKPSVGLSPAQTASQVQTLIEAGLDFVKDDELMGDSPHSPFRERVDAVMAIIHRYADQTGRKPMFAFNLTGDVDDMRWRHDYVLEKGGTCVMVSINWAGISGVAKLRQHAQLPIHGHRNGWGIFDRSEILGIAFPAYQKLWRLAGVDHLHTNGIRNKFCETDESVIRSVKACYTPLLGGYEIMPVLSSGQWADQALDTYRHIQRTDLMYLCGGGITGHPDGLAAGVRSVRLAWEGAIQGKSIDDMAADHPEIDRAIAFFRSKTT